MDREATFNQEGNRTRLTRRWNAQLPSLVVVLSKASTASHIEDDYTTKRLVSIAKHLGRGRLELYNLHPDMSSSELAGLRAEINLQPEVVVAWGGASSNRPKECLQLFQELDYTGRVCCFRQCSNGAPAMGTREKTEAVTLQHFPLN